MGSKPEPAASAKPRLRGVLHSYAAFASLCAGLTLFSLVRTTAIRHAVIVYVASLILLYGSSSLYHWPTWPHVARSWLRRLDHASIYCLIAGTYTPICIILLSSTEAQRLLTFIWGIAVLGCLHQLFWPGGPKWVSASLYTGMALSAWFYGGNMTAKLSSSQAQLLVAGGICYITGAVAYAAHWPNLRPGIFGYHELFHAFVMVASACHFASITDMLRADFINGLQLG